MVSLIENVLITTYVSPHLFWVIERGNEKRCRIIATINQEFENILNKPIDESFFEAGQLVAVEYNKKLYRGLIENIHSVGFDEENNIKRLTNYMCWLIDYGTMVETDKVYTLPLKLRKIPPLSLQVCLNNIAFLQQRLTYGIEGQPIMKKEYAVIPTPRSRNVSNEILSGFQDFHLQYEYIQDDIYFGDILSKANKDTKSLKQELIKAEIIEANEDFFKTLQGSIKNYREKHLRIITSICKDNANILEGKETLDINISLKKISLKKMQEYGHDDQTIEKLEKQFENIPKPYRNKNKSRNNDNFNGNTESDQVSTKTTRRQVLVKLLQEKHKSSPLANINNDDSGITTSDFEQITTNGGVLKSPCSGAHANESNNDTEITSNGFEQELMCEDLPKSPFYRLKENGVKKRSNIPSSFEIIPAGASHSLSKKKKTEVTVHKKHERNENFPSRETGTKNKYKKTYSSEENISSKEKTSISSEEIALSKAKNSYSSEENTPSREISTQSSEESLGTGGVNNTLSGNSKPMQLLVKPHCSCAKCNFWTENKDWDIKTDYQTENGSEISPCNTHFLFKKGDYGKYPSVLSLDCNFKKKLGEKSKPKLLLHSENIPTPLFLVAEVNFHPNVLKNLMHLGYKESKKIQAYTWQSLLRNQNIFMVHGPRTGKTLAYLPVMCTFMLEKEDRYYDLAKSGGPICVILCSNSRKCEDIYCLINKILESKKSKIVLVTNPNISVSLHNTDMLITSPTILVELLKFNKINFKRLCHLILEDGTKIINQNSEILDKILRLVDNMLHQRKFSKAVQLVICAEHWDKRLEKLLKSLEMLPLVCIGNYLEAAIYGGITFSIQIMDSSYKGKELTDLLKDSYRIFKTIMFCNKLEIEEIQHLLLLKGIDATIIDDDLSEEQITYLQETWEASEEGQYTVMVCTDVTFNTMMTISSSAILVHYSLPNSWTKFVKRFSSLLASCKSPLDQKKVKGIYRSSVFCDENSKEHAYKFLSYLNETDMKYQLSQFNLSEILRRLEGDKIKNSIDFCDVAKLFGKCSKSGCPKRHVLNRVLDVSDFLPKYGKIRFKIVDMVNLTHYLINLIQHFDDKNTKTDYDVEDITEKLTDTLTIQKSSIVNPVIGHYYAYKCDGSNLFYRCQLLKNGDDYIKIILIDKGSFIKSTKYKIYHLPNEFSIEYYPQKVIEIYFSNCIPPYRDECFPQKSTSIYKHELDKIDYKNQIFEGVVVLQLANTLWLKDVYEQKLLSDNSVIPGLQLIKEAVRLQLVEYNQSQFNNLQTLCTEAGVFVPIHSTQQKHTHKEIERVSPQWAHLDVENPNEVIFSSAVSPEEFYVRLNKNNDLLYKLQKEIQNEIKKPNYPTLQSVVSGDLCLAPLPNENEYYRAIIQKHEENKALCFFVDFGDEGVTDLSGLKYISDKFITKLPFQSIQCAFHGLTPVLSEWQTEATDILYDYGVEPQTDIFRTLYAKVSCKKESSITNQKSYSVILKDGYGDRNIIINQLLIDCGLACSNSEIYDFEIPDQKDITDEDVELNYKEEILDICRKTDEIDENFHMASNGFIEDMDMEFFSEDPKEFFKELLNYSKPQSENPVFQELPLIGIVDPVDYKTPEVVWYQTETAVRISIKLTGTTDCHISLTKNRIMNFRATKNNQLYSLKLILYEYASSIQYTLSGPDIRITLTKSKNLEWSRLILPKQPARNIHYDLTMLKIEERQKKFLDIPKDVDNSDSTDNERDMMYHVYSDLDSEFDIELEDSD